MTSDLVVVDEVEVLQRGDHVLLLHTRELTDLAGVIAEQKGNINHQLRHQGHLRKMETLNSKV